MSFSELLESAINDKIKDIQLGMIGKIDSFDSAKMRADVDPLLKIKNDEGEEIELPILPDLPVRFFYGGGFLIKPTYQSGDLVWISFSTHDLENSLQEYKRAASEKKFEIHNACVMGGVVKDNFIFPLLQLNALNKDGMVLVNEGGIGLRVDDIGLFALNGPIEFNILTHTHTAIGLGAPTSPPIPGS